MNEIIGYFKDYEEVQDWKTAFLAALAIDVTSAATMADVFVAALRERKEPIALYNVEFIRIGHNRVTTVKALRAHTGMSLKEAVDTCSHIADDITPIPYRLASGVIKREANRIAEDFESVGAGVTITEAAK